MSLEDDIKAAALAIRTSVQELTEEVTALRAQLAENSTASRPPVKPQDILDEDMAHLANQVAKEHLLSTIHTPPNEKNPTEHPYAPKPTEEPKRTVDGEKAESKPSKPSKPKQEVAKRPEEKAEPTTTDKTPTFTEVQTAFRKFVGCHTKEECIAMLTRFEVVGKLTEEKIDPLMHQAFLDALVEDGHNQELVD